MGHDRTVLIAVRVLPGQQAQLVSSSDHRSCVCKAKDHESYMLESALLFALIPCSSEVRVPSVITDLSSKDTVLAFQSSSEAR